MPSAADNQTYTLTPSRGYRYLFRLAAITILLNGIFLGTMCWILQEGRQQYELRARAAGQNISKATSQSLADEFDKIDLIVLSARDEIRGQFASGGIDAARLNGLLLQLKERLPELNALRASDAKGVIRYGDGIDASSPVSMARDEHFIYLRDHSEAGAIIGKPKFCTISRIWVVTVARAYHDADGAFAGVVSGVMAVERLTRIFTRLDAGQHGFIALRDSRLAFMARHPKLEDGKFIGERVASPEFRTLIEAGHASGTLNAASPIDGMTRLVSFDKVGNWPLYVSVGLSAEDYLSAWRKTVRNIILTAAVISLASAFVAWLLYRSWKDKALYIQMLTRNQNMFRILAEMSSDWIWEQDSHFRFTHIAGNPGSRGPNGEFLLGKTRWDLATDTDDPKWALHRALLEAHRPFQDFEYECLDNSDSKRSFFVSGTPLFGPDGVFQGYRGITKDITERKTYEERIHHMAQHDSLTQMPNRLMFYDRVGQTIRMARRKDVRFALLYLDLDGFKSVNDRFGHGAGDQVLVEVADRMRARLRESDTLSRLGGDEFAMIVPEIASDDDVRTVAAKLIEALAVPFELADAPEPVAIGLSAGIAIFPADGDSADQLIRAADRAMYRAKAVGNSFCFFSAERDQVFGHDSVKIGVAVRSL